MNQTWWIEVNAWGRILQKTDGSEPRPMFGGTVHEVDTKPDPVRNMYIDGELLDLGERPSFDHYLDEDARAWVVPGRSELQVAQDAKWTDIKNERDRLESTTFPYMGRSLQCDVVSVLRMTGAKEAALMAIEAGIPFSETWTCADNTLLPVDAHTVLGMLPALAVWSSGLHATARTLRAAIYAEDATLTSVAAVAWPP